MILSRDPSLTQRVEISFNRLLISAVELRASMTQKRQSLKLKDTHRRYTEDLNNEADPMLLHGHSALSVTKQLALPIVSMHRL